MPGVLSQTFGAAARETCWDWGAGHGHRLRCHWRSQSGGGTWDRAGGDTGLAAYGTREEGRRGGRDLPWLAVWIAQRAYELAEPVLGSLSPSSLAATGDRRAHARSKQNFPDIFLPEAPWPGVSHPDELVCWFGLLIHDLLFKCDTFLARSELFNCNNLGV